MERYGRDRFWKDLTASIPEAVDGLADSSHITHSLDQIGSPDFFSLSKDSGGEIFNLQCEYLRDESLVRSKITAMSSSCAGSA
jgi:hypothetical protein